MTIILPNNFKAFTAEMGAALVASVASSFCCIGPLVYLVFGVSAASLAGLEQYGWLHYPMLLLSSLLMMMGFWRIYLSPKPLCVGILSRMKLQVLYWLTLILVLAFQTYPYVLPWILE